MNLKVLSFLRRSNRLLSRILPQSTHSRLVRVVKAAYTEYKRTATTTNCVADYSVASKIGKLIKYGNVVEPLAPFVTCSGKLIENDKDLVVNLAKLMVENKCELVICCAFLGRHQILERAVAESLNSDEAANIRWMLVGSTPEDYKFIRALAIKTGKVAGTIVENNPLGRKWQNCSKLATLYFDADLYGITGSDDMLSSRLIDHIIGRHRKNKSNIVDPEFMPSMYATLEWLVCNTNAKTSFSPQIIKCNYEYESAFQPLGAGRFYTKAFMNKFKGEIFESTWEKCLDDKGYFMVRDNNKTLEYYTVEDGPIVSIKGNWSQLNPIEAFFEAKTLSLHEYTFIGNALLHDSLSESSYRFLFKSATIAPQLNFSKICSSINA